MAAKKKTAPKKAAKKAAAPKAAKAAKLVPNKSGSITIKQVAALLADKYTMPKAQANLITGDMFDTIAGEIRRGNKVRVPGFGIFLVAKRAARMGRNPATGEPIKIKASKKVRFRVAKELKESI
jgi:DNA-binding protein HU-beta